MDMCTNNQMQARLHILNFILFSKIKKNPRLNTKRNKKIGDFFLFLISSIYYSTPARVYRKSNRNYPIPHSRWLDKRQEWVLPEMWNWNIFLAQKKKINQQTHMLGGAQLTNVAIMFPYERIHGFQNPN
ncbi:hypothetical protein HZS_1419 [Henneguya salminicola]|nr:hypothetical protein HZS_1419 [Henneguya salminicola]